MGLVFQYFFYSCASYLETMADRIDVTMVLIDKTAVAHARIPFALVIRHIEACYHQQPV
jgi:hypothetical protein